MGNDILTTIIAVEQEIQARLAVEEQAAAQLLGQLKRDLELEASREEELLALSVQKALAACKAEARQLAEAAARRAARRAEQLDSFDDPTLERCIMKYLNLITVVQSQ